MSADRIIMKSISLVQEVQDENDAHCKRISNKQYVHHPLRVMASIAIMPNVSELEIAGALLHNVHESPPFISLERIEQEIHPQVAKYVGDLTNPSKKLIGAHGAYPREWTRTRRKTMDIEHLSKCDFWTQTIKAADCCDHIEELITDLYGDDKPPLNIVYLYCNESEALANALEKIDAKQREKLKNAVHLLRSIANMNETPQFDDLRYF